MKSTTLNRNVIPGDRVELSEGENQFATVLEVRQGPHWRETRVLMSDGTEKWLQPSQCWFSPDPEALQHRKQLIQSEWSANDRNRRAGISSEEQSEGYQVPYVRLHATVLSSLNTEEY